MKFKKKTKKDKSIKVGEIGERKKTELRRKWSKEKRKWRGKEKKKENKRKRNEVEYGMKTEITMKKDVE